jgi:hypothetical protein
LPQNVSSSRATPAEMSTHHTYDMSQTQQKVSTSFLHYIINAIYVKSLLIIFVLKRCEAELKKYAVSV